MRIHSVALLISALVFITSAKAQDQTASQTPEYVQAFDAAFRVAFRKSTIEQCIASAKASEFFDLTPTCGCLADTLLTTKTVGELSKLATDEKLKAEIQPITMECLKLAPPIRK